MVNNCKHFVEPFFDDVFSEPFFDDVFSEPKKPTEHQIRKYKIYQCKKCHKWFSFLKGMNNSDIIN